MATEVVHSLRKSGGDYELMSAWHADQVRDLVAVDEIAIIECYNDWQDEAGLDDRVTMNNWGTDEDHYTVIRCPEGEGHGGYAGPLWPGDAGFPGFVIINRGSNYNNGVIRNNSLFSQMYGFGIANLQGSNANSAGIWTNSTVLCHSIIAKTAGSGPGIDCRGSSTVYNCVSYNADPTATRGAIPFGNNNFVYNCLAIHANPAFYPHQSTSPNNTQNDISNCISLNGAGFAGWNFISERSVSNYSTTLDAADLTNDVTEISDADFADAVGGDYRPASGGLLDGGGTPFPEVFDTDITGAPREPDNWTAGPWNVPLTVVTHTLKSDGGDYTSMAAWQSDQLRNLPEAGEIAKLECFKGTSVVGGWQESGALREAFRLQNWTVDPTHFVEITTGEGEGHDGVVGKGFIMEVASGTSAPFRVSQAYTYVHDFQVRVILSANANAGVFEGIGNRSHRNIFTAFTNNGVRIACTHSAADYQIITSNLYYGLATGAMASIDSRSDDSVFTGNTSINLGTGPAFAFGASSAADVAFYNNVFFGDFIDQSVRDPVTNNAFTQSEAELPETFIDCVYDITEGDFFDFGNDDFLPRADGKLFEAGVTREGADFDIRGNDRVEPWDIGAYENTARLVTSSIRAAGGDYESLEAWQADKQRDLADLNESEVAQGYDDWPEGLDTAITISGWGTDFENRLGIEGAPGNEPNGQLGAGFRLTQVTGGANDYIVNASAQPWFGMRRMGVVIAASKPSQRMVNLHANSEFRQNVVDMRNYESGGSLTGIGVSCFSVSGADPDYHRAILNNFTIGGFNGIYTVRQADVVYNTVVGCAEAGIVTVNSSAAELMEVRNNVAYDCVAEDMRSDSSPQPIASNNATGDNTAIGDNPLTGVLAGDFVDAGSDNYVPVAGGQLDPLSNPAIPFGRTVVDITDEVRGIPPTRGAYEAQEPAETFPPTDVNAGGPYTNIKTDGTVQLDGSFTPGTGPGQYIAWTSDEPGGGEFSDETILNPTYTPRNVGDWKLTLTVGNDAGENSDVATLTAYKAIAFVGFVDDIDVPVGQEFTRDISGEWEGSKPRQYTERDGWPPAANLDPVTGVITWTPNNSYDYYVASSAEETEEPFEQAYSNDFNMRSYVEDIPISFSGTIQDIEADVGQTVQVDVSDHWDGTLRPFEYKEEAEGGTNWPPEASIDSVTGVITFSPTAAGETGGHAVTALDTGDNFATSNTFGFKASLPGTNPVITLQPEDETVTETEDATFTGAAEGEEPLRFVWFVGAQQYPDEGPTFVYTASLEDDGAQVGFFVFDVYERFSISQPATLTVVQKITFTGIIAEQIEVAGDPFYLNVSENFEGANRPFVYSSAQLPWNGLSLNEFTGEVTGTPEAEGVLPNVVITGQDTALFTADTNAFTITITAAAVPIDFPGTVPNQSIEQNKPYELDLAQGFTGSEQPFSYELIGTLPRGLSFSDGVISGTPLDVETATGLVVRGTDQLNNTADTNPFNIDVTLEEIPVRRTAQVPDQSYALGETFSFQLSSYFEGNLRPFTYAVTQGTLPSWASLDPNTGEISGTVDTTQSETLTVTVTDTGDNIALTNPFTIAGTQVQQRREYLMDEGEGTVINATTPGLEGAWDDAVGWQTFDDNSRRYPMNLSENGESATLICQDGTGKRREELDGIINNYDPGNWR